MLPPLTLLKPLQKPSHDPYLAKYSGLFLGPNTGDDFVALDTVEDNVP